MSKAEMRGEVSEDFEQAFEKEWKSYVDRGAATVDALEDNTQELAFAKGFFRGWNYPKSSVWHDASERPKQKKEIVFQWQSVDSDKKWLDVGVYHKRGDYMKTIGKDGEDTIEMKYVIRWANSIDLLKL